MQPLREQLINALMLNTQIQKLKVRSTTVWDSQTKFNL